METSYCPHCQKDVPQGIEACPDGHPGPLLVRPAAPAAQPGGFTPPTAPAQVQLATAPQLDPRDEELARLRQALQAKQTPEERHAAEMAELRAGQQRLQRMLEESQAAQRQATLVAFRERRLRELKEQGTLLFEENVVAGPDEAAIEASIKSAAAAYKRAEEHFKARLVPATGEQPQPAATHQPPVGHQTYAAPGPAAFPRPVQAQAPVQADAGAQEFTQQVRGLTSEAAVRNGDYAKNRAALHQALRQGGPPPVGAPFANQPRYGWQTTQFPQGLPTPQPTMPQLQAQAPNPANLPPAPVTVGQPSPMQPQVAPQVMHQVGQPQQLAPVPLMMPQPGVQGQQMVDPTAYLPQVPQARPAPQNGAQQVVGVAPDFLAASGQASTSHNEARARAIHTARTHLGNIRGPAARPDGQVNFNHAAIQEGTAQIGNGVNPMIRNSA